MIYVIGAIIIVLLIAYTAWKDFLYQKHLARLELLVKSRDVEEFVRAEAAEAEINEPDEPLESDDTEDLDDVDPQDTIAAIRKSDKQP